MSRAAYIARFLGRQADALAALGRYALHRHDLSARLAASFPGLSVETTNICNADCTFCAYQYQSRLTGVMDMGLFRRIIDQYCEIGGGPLSLTPTVGDPLVDPLLVERIAYARSKPQIAAIGMISNMILLRRFSPAALIDAGLSSLSVSTTGFDPEMYERIYRSRMFERVYAAIIDFATVNNRRGRPVAFTLGLRTDVPRSEVVDSARYRAVALLVGEENIHINVFMDDWGGLIRQQDLTGGMKLRNGSAINRALLALKRPRISACTELYSGPMVYWDGTVGACGCRDVDASGLVIGNAKTSHLGDIWFGREIDRLRREFLTDRAPALCRSCSHYNNLALLLQSGQREYLAQALSRTVQWNAAAPDR